MVRLMVLMGKKKAEILASQGFQLVEHSGFEAENTFPVAFQSVPYGNILKPKSAFAA